jgi:hypothetical protein
MPIFVMLFGYQAAEDVTTPDEASAAVTRLGGHVLKRLGDGLMALFGYPQAQENEQVLRINGAEC